MNSNEQSIMMGQRNELSILSSAYVPIDMANVIGNADDFEESKDEGSSVPEPSVRMTTNHYTKQS